MNPGTIPKEKAGLVRAQKPEPPVLKNVKRFFRASHLDDGLSASMNNLLLLTLSGGKPWISYLQPGQKLGATVEWVDPKTNLKIVLPVPVQFRGEEVRLVAEHPDCTVEINGSKLVIKVREPGKKD